MKPDSTKRFRVFIPHRALPTTERILVDYKKRRLCRYDHNLQPSPWEKIKQPSPFLIKHPEKSRLFKFCGYASVEQLFLLKLQ